MEKIPADYGYLQKSETTGEKTLLINFPESTSRTAQKTVTIPNLKSVLSVSVNTGNVTYSVNGNNVTINVLNGTYTRYTTSGSPAGSKNMTGQNSGSSSYIRSDSYPWDSDYNAVVNGWGNRSSMAYNDGTYSGTLNLSVSGYWLNSGCTTANCGRAVSWSYSGTVYKPDTTSTTYYYAYTVTIIYIDNSRPLLSVNSSDNQTLSEGSKFTLEGTATDPDTGNVLTIKYKINNSPARALTSGVSDGSSPLSFSKTLKYSNKRLWDGSTDVTGADLAENTDHVLTVWAEDDQGGKSAEVTRKFRVIWNRPPVISGTNTDLGTIKEPPKQMYTVTEPENDTFTITEKINGSVIRSFQGVAGREETASIPHDRWIRLDLDTPHTLTVEAKDAKGLTASRTYTFTRTETHIEFMLDMGSPDVQSHFILDGMPQRVLVTLERYIPEGASIESVKVCNNALDASPTWEDATNAVKSNRGYLFTNKTKTAANWAINIWVLIAKGAATERVKLNGYGGAFD